MPWRRKVIFISRGVTLPPLTVFIYVKAGRTAGFQTPASSMILMSTKVWKNYPGASITAPMRRLLDMCHWIIALHAGEAVERISQLAVESNNLRFFGSLA